MLACLRSLVNLEMPTNDKGKKSSASNAKLCSNCSAPEGSASAPKLSACSRCGLEVYCSRDCQRVHWKLSHKQHCVAKADRAPQLQKPFDGLRFNASKATATEEECSICLSPLIDASTCTLPCTHVFHGACVEQLRNFGVQQVCPLCRTPLSSTPEQLSDEAIRRYLVVDQMVDRGEFVWWKLPDPAQREMDAVIAMWRVAADEGYYLAQRSMARMHSLGYGVAQSYEEAAQWWSKAAEQGDVEALNKLGLLYKEGRGVTQSDEQAMRWWRKAADQEDAEAQCNIGVMFEEGRGVEQSDVEAARWYSKSAECGYVPAQFILGLCFADGRGVSQIYEKAAKWFETAADGGHAKAQYF